MSERRIRSMAQRPALQCRGLRMATGRLRTSSRCPCKAAVQAHEDQRSHSRTACARASVAAHCHRIVKIIVMPIAPGAGARLRHYMRPGPASAVYPAKADGFLHGAANQLHYLQRPGLVGLVPSNRVMDCVGMVRKALFDEMTPASQQAVRARIETSKAPETFEDACNMRVIYDVTLTTPVLLNANKVPLAPSADLHEWKVGSSSRSETDRVRLNDVVSFEGRLLPRDRIEQAWHHALIEQATPCDAQRSFWHAPIAEHDEGAFAFCDC